MNKLLIMILAAMVMMPLTAQAQRSDSIAAVVNGDVITYTDLYDRINLVITSARMPNNKEFKSRLLPQVLTGMITETIQLQEASRLGLTTEQADIDRAFAELSAQNQLQPAQFKQVLRRDGIAITTLEKQMEAQLAWSKVIQSEIRPRVTLTDNDINDELARLKSREGQEEYFIAEIFLPYGGESNSPEADVRKAASDLSKQLRRDSKRFSAAARQFSQSATAATGGVIGWVTPDQLDEELALKLNTLKVGKVSDPIKTDDGYSLLLVREKRTINLSGGDSAESLRIKVARFEVPVEEAERMRIMDDIDIFKRDVKGCLDIIAQTTKRDYATLQNFEDTASNIPTTIVSAVENSPIGEVGEAIEADNIVSIPMLCGRTGGGSTAALEKEIENRMGMQRMDNLQKQYLRDLIANAYIERRV